MIFADPGLTPTLGYGVRAARYPFAYADLGSCASSLLSAPSCLRDSEQLGDVLGRE
jgi:hypothetical protein